MMTAERQLVAERCVAILLECLGENPRREGLDRTPARVVRALQEMTGGYDQDPGKILSTCFDNEGYDEMVLVRGIPFSSLCEHHMLPFQGVVHVGYIPKGKVVGLSKIPRLVQAYARRLQIQERMTTTIAVTLEAQLNPKGVGVVVDAHHSCMSLRGVKSDGRMVTSALRGVFRDDPSARTEFLNLIG